MGFEMDGLDELIKKLDDAGDVVADAAGRAVKDVSESVFERTQERVPKKTLALMNSGSVKEDQTTGMVRSAVIHYGDSDTDRVGVYYAAAVHEILSHTHESPTGAKYVEGPMLEGIEDFKRKLAEEVGRALREHLK